MIEVKHIIFIPESGQMPDAFTDVVNELPPGIKPRIVPWSGSVADGVQAVESILDREEIRRVILVGAGTGAGVALQIARNQPRRVERLVLDSPLVSFDDKQLKSMSAALNIMPGFLFRKRNKKELLKQVEDARTAEPPQFSDITVPTLIIKGSSKRSALGNDLEQQLPDVQSTTINGADWLTFTTHGRQTGAAITKFLAD
ncbi:alpha/beta fold hydrolase [Corynebacterium crudilactis]|uniref:Alpha/beta hydrolase n=1 Tax=Corynebacterium crudilactis TaxID=1652495 RepID=A0A172QW25_9CORY|nr:alpha/beta hydrolase [Corynebacterium crudilactis]ANE04909.1 alpha/beta hydrolase [Corynebacterium crudilactis]